MEITVERRYRKLSDLSLIDDYLFGLFIQEAGNEEIIKGMLERMLDMKIESIDLSEKQHTIMSDPENHSIRLDAFVRDDKGTLYNIEVQTVNTKNIPKRIRYYQSLIDREQMPSGEYDYNILPKTIIIFVTDFDLFGKGLYRYTFKNICMEDKSVSLGDDTLKVLLNTRGKRADGVSEELIGLLRYFVSSDTETASHIKSEFIQKIDKMLKPIKNDTKFGGDFMSFEEAMYTQRRLAIEEGIAEGRAKGIAEGRAKGIAEGEIKGKIEGFIHALFKVGKTSEEIITNVEQEFTVSRDIAEGYVNEYRPVR